MGKHQRRLRVRGSIGPMPKAVNLGGVGSLRNITSRGKHLHAILGKILSCTVSSVPALGWSLKVGLGALGGAEETSGVIFP